MISRLVLNSRIINKNTIISSNVAVSSLFRNNNNNKNNNIIYINRSFCSKDQSKTEVDKPFGTTKEAVKDLDGNNNSTEATCTDSDDYIYSDELTNELSYEDADELTDESLKKGDKSLYSEESNEDESVTEIEIESVEEKDEYEELEDQFAGENADADADAVAEAKTEAEALTESTIENELEDDLQVWGVTYRGPKDLDESDELPFIPIPTDKPILPTLKAPRKIEDLIIKYEDPFKDPSKTNANYFPYFRFTEPRGYTVESFLKQIGRGCDQHVELFEKWEDLMETSPRKLKDLQVPVSNRKWILHWVEQFKQGRDPVLISKSKSKAKSNKKK
ncbi:hypothetical protein ACTFIU_008411 [Dictyostelium citrinum]